MINEDLITFIQSQAKKNRSQSEISSRLAKVGWHIDDIEEGFRAVALREPAFVEPFVEPKAFNESSEPITTITIPSLELEARNSPEEPRELAVPVEVSQELQVIQPIESIIPSEVKEEPSSIHTSLPAPASPLFKVQTPVSVVIPPIVPLSPQPPLVVETIQPEPFSPLPELIPKEEIPVKENLIPKKEDIEYPDMPTLPSTPFSAQTPADVKPIFVKKESSIPIKPLTIDEPPQTLEDIQNNLPGSAIITTYSRAMMTSNNTSSPVTARPNSFNKKKFIIILGIVFLLSIIAGVIFAFHVGYISLPTFVKKDSKSALLATAYTYNNLSSYKSTTKITISLPLIANITNGLVSGDPTESKDKDSISLTINTARNNDARTNVSDSRIRIQSSLLKNDIISQLVSDSKVTYATIPDLSSILKRNTPPQGIISIKNEQIDSLIALFPNLYVDKIRQSKLYKEMIRNTSITTKDQIVSYLKDLIKTATVVQKPDETVRGVNTYHYSMIFERQEIKKFLSSTLHISEIPLSDTEKNNLIESFGSTNGTTLDMWVGKDDSIVYQYKLRTTIPLSKVINLDDKGISGNEVVLDWQTEYFDINVPNTIEFPPNSIPTPLYLNLIKDITLKNNVVDLKPAIALLHNAEGSYGKRTNSTGSCTNPNPSSVFSPLGHTKGSINAVGAIADSMKTILTITNGAGACYSTQTAWATSFPLSSNPQSSYCIDTKGEVKVLTTPLNGTICK